MPPLHVLAVYGTRPEAIKMAPVVAALRRRPSAIRLTVCATAQHREMLDQLTGTLGLAPDLDLDLMRPEQRLNLLSARALERLDAVLESTAPDWLLVQGDTTTAMSAAIAAFHRGVRVGHVEAGLRTGDLADPFPEEANRRVVDLLSAALFAPTPGAAARLAAEGSAPERIHVVGNPVIDALRAMAETVGTVPPGGTEVLVTVHRRESFGAPLRGILTALRELAERFPEVEWIYPVHPNPQVRGPAHATLGDVPNLRLLEPLPYPELVRRLLGCRFVLTDSGGLQEEAPAFAKPVLVLRATTERPEGLAAGVARLVGVDPASIVAEASALLTDPAAYDRMARTANPYGDGHAGERIAAILAGEAWEAFSPSLLATPAVVE